MVYLKITLCFLLGLIYETRRRLPLYADDHSKIFTAYARALMWVFQDKKLSQSQRIFVFKTYAQNFKWEVSVARFGDLIHVDEMRDAFLIDADFRFRYDKRNLKVLQFMRRLNIYMKENLGYEFPDYDRNKMRKDIIVERRKLANIERATARKQQRARVREKHLKKRDANKLRLEKKRQKLKLNAEKNAEARIAERLASVERRRAKALTYSKMSALMRPLNIFRHRILARLNIFNYFSGSFFSTDYVQLKYFSPQDENAFFEYNALRPKSEVFIPAHAVLCLMNASLDILSLEALEDYEHITVLVANSVSEKNIKTELALFLGEHVEISVRWPLREHVAAYSKGDQHVSDFCDKFGHRLIQEAMSTASIRRFVPSCLDDDLGVGVSDAIYRTVHGFYAQYKSLREFDFGTPIFFANTSLRLPFTFARAGYEYVIVANSETIDKGAIPESPSPHPLSAKRLTRTLRHVIKGLKTSLKAVLPSHDTPDKPQVFVATNSRAGVYRNVSNLIASELKEGNTSRILDVAPVTKESPNLYQALHSVERSHLRKFTGSVAIGVANVMQHVDIDDVPLHEITGLLSSVVDRNVGPMTGSVMLYRHMFAYLERHSKAKILLVPGRQSVLRCAARAFQSRGLPSLDVQALFVSEMARYKPPIAEHHAVIDSFARDHYVEHFNVDPKTIEMIGALPLDDDIIKAKNLGRAAAYADVFSEPDGLVFTYASQPLGERETLEAVVALAEYILTNDTMRLCVKLHPAQSESLQEQIKTLLAGIFGDDKQGRWCVLRREPFWSVMPMTDILLSYFSNVCLMAPAFNVPVVSLPTNTPVPKINFPMMGLAYQVDDLKLLESVLEQVIRARRNPSKEDPPYLYLAKNPHMEQVNSLERLIKIVKKLSV